MSDYRIVNPATGESEAPHPQASAEDIESALASATDAFHAWRRTSIAERQDLLRRLAYLHEERAPELAAVMAREMGKPVRSGRGEIGLCAEIFRYYADHAEEFLADEVLPQQDGSTALLRTAPLGPLLGIMPWNYPYYQVARFAAPNLLLGNVILLKHAPQCPESALRMAAMFADAGLLSGGYTNLFVDNDQAARIIADPRVQGVSLTGSERAGASVAEVAGRHVKKVVLELGGSDPFIVLDTDDLEGLVAEAIVGRMGNCGQACNAAKRFVVLAEVYDAFVERFAEGVAAIRVGDPLDEGTTMGPLSSFAARDEVAAQVDDALAKGAVAMAGGGIVPGPGAYFQPTVLTGVGPGMRAWGEEIFGPVAVVHKVADTAEAIRVANDSPYGLSASVHTTDPDRALELVDLLDAGMVYINESPSTAADLPFGGVKRSGYGRELGRLGILEFANRKLIKLRK
ncbi:NAD-dependent succinate-semialdehyde dehydrogenase [Streptomyces zhihengii]|uniref:NAD-dependent succinate-semialdehyde dehydrogenase n=1 Tax=Streptomyces zhihengii TaxID=1818004 RepID=A0ABS2V456_9ACTN|nr:NAD-dependent succinate-semialdehyde dehydrogenase [Streptomyces zhihengii]MBM9624622.1 NAD-dependent succinate-semialdehyde dehydrogenase [Streptomyces zhihengii]